MNQDQILSIARAVLQVVGTGLVSKGLIGTADWSTIMGAVLMVVPVIWGMMAHTDAAKVAAVEAMPSVKQIVVNSSIATDGIADAANDPLRPKVTKG